MVRAKHLFAMMLVSILERVTMEQNGLSVRLAADIAPLLLDADLFRGHHAAEERERRRFLDVNLHRLPG